MPACIEQEGVEDIITRQPVAVLEIHCHHTSTPCFTDGPPRNFVMRVYGLDVDGKIIAYGEKILPYPIG